MDCGGGEEVRSERERRGGVSLRIKVGVYEQTFRRTVRGREEGWEGGGEGAEEGRGGEGRGGRKAPLPSLFLLYVRPGPGTWWSMLMRESQGRVRIERS